MRKISVGSENPVKIAAVKNVIKRIWPNAKIVPVKIQQDIKEQPLSDDEAIKGATHRAKLSLRKTNSDLGIGLEGCTIDTKQGMFATSWVVAIDKKGRVGIGGTGKVLLPEKVASEIRKGKELGPVMDRFTGGYNVKQKQGAVGILTKNLVTRTTAYENAVIYSLTKFINPEYYE